MREILFRGKRAGNGEWVYGDLLQNVDCLKIREQEKDINHIARSFEIIPETVGQYTGLTDKNGVKIFEGDIVKCSDGRLHIVKTGNFYPEHLYKLCSLFGEVCVGAEHIGLIYGVYAECVSNEFKGEHFIIPKKNVVEVIGHIHDNPELLKGGAE